MEINFWDMFIRTVASFFAILFLARLIGKKQLSQLTFFHYVTGITIGSISADISAQKETPFFDGLLALIWWTVLTILVSYISMKSQKLRILFDDRPTVIIENGNILIKNLKKSRLSFDDLSMLLREQNIFDFSEVQYAVFETNGQLSVLKYVDNQSALRSDINKKINTNQQLPLVVVVRGTIIYEHLDELGLNEDLLLKKLKKQSNKDLAAIDFAQVQSDGSLYISTSSN